MSAVREFNMLVLLAASGILSLLLAGMLVNNWRRARLPGLGLVTAAVALTPAGFILIALRGKIPDTFSVVLGNLCFILALVYLGNGIRRLAGRPTEWLTALTLSAAAVMLLVYFTFFHNAVELRIIAMSSLIAVFSLINAADTRALTAAGPGPRALLAASQTGLALLMLYRIRAATFGPPPESLLQGGSSHVAGIVGALVFLFLITVGVLWATRRLEGHDKHPREWELAA